MCYQRLGLTNKPESTPPYDSDELNRRWTRLWGLNRDDLLTRERQQTDDGRSAKRLWLQAQ